MHRPRSIQLNCSIGTCRHPHALLASPSSPLPLPSAVAPFLCLFRPRRPQYHCPRHPVSPSSAFRVALSSRRCSRASRLKLARSGSGRAPGTAFQGRPPHVTRTPRPGRRARVRGGPWEVRPHPCPRAAERPARMPPKGSGAASPKAPPTRARRPGRGVRVTRGGCPWRAAPGARPLPDRASLSRDARLQRREEGATLKADEGETGGRGR